ncbi:MAG TPA: CheR family methyltransferase, partial [Anaeromyxobacteraceae bacterium]|nr:CheR family methyltransferase [Anaeromyxobacteraceae bacterium]
MPTQDALEAILDKIRQARNFDFRNYKRATLRRRIERRMGDRKCRTMHEYEELLDGSPEEYDALISGMFIKVTSFFRDPEAWDALRRTVLPELVKSKEPGSELRVWSVGCATGEETYSAAILLAEAVGNRADAPQVKVFGTDVDEGAIAVARRGIYSQGQLQEVSKERLQRFFVPVPEGWAIRNEVRRSVVFGVNNLVSDAPISRLDLLICRNVFIYLDASLQKRVLSRFHYALRPEGVLFLGKSELIPFAAKLFEAVDLSRRIYRRGDRRGREVVDEDRLAGIIEQEDVSRAARQTREELAALGQFHRDLVNALPTPVIATTVDGGVSCWNAAAARLWRRTESEVVGKRLTALGLPGLPGDLLLEKTAQVRDGKVERRQGEAMLEVDGTETVLSTEVMRLHDAASELVGLLYVVTDVTAVRGLDAELRQTRDERQK